MSELISTLSTNRSLQADRLQASFYQVGKAVASLLQIESKISQKITELGRQLINFRNTSPEIKINNSLSTEAIQQLETIQSDLIKEKQMIKVWLIFAKSFLGRRHQQLVVKPFTQPSRKMSLTQIIDKLTTQQEELEDKLRSISQLLTRKKEMLAAEEARSMAQAKEASKALATGATSIAGIVAILAIVKVVRPLFNFS